eukprot:TRINITY_DN74645_c0_g1_i1.p1 TRINITY_DN74645_c0_g1~~TRINITY_DN74645_c0_g1_i1.p1  ORF type:complete len:583 (-),score=136.70 TRINITY_DN74645_c0_g1_i1:57-1742(-)
MAGEAEAGGQPLEPALLVLALLLVPQIIDFAAQLLQRSRIGQPVPPALSDIYDEEEYKISMAYTREKSTFGLIKDSFDLVVFVAFWFCGGFGLIQERCAAHGWSVPVTGLLFFGILSALNELVSIPWSLYQTFVIEERYGFNNTSARTFIMDKIKALFLVVLIGSPLLFIVQWFFVSLGNLAWLYAWITLSVFQVVLFFVAPALLLPIFLQMEPLPGGKAIIVEGFSKKGPRSFLNRILYEEDELFANKPAYVTKDRQSVRLSLHFSAAKKRYVLAEGASAKEASEMGEGAIFASCTDPAQPRDLSQFEIEHRVLPEQTPGVAAVTATAAPLLGAERDDAMRVRIVQVGQLRDQLLALAKKLEYNCTKLFVIDGSTRSAHSNAFCTGSGEWRRICLFDTLLAQMSIDEITAVLGHEIGHDKLWHTIRRLALGIVLSFVMFFTMGKFIEDKFLAEAFFLPEPAVYSGLLIFSLVWGVLEFFISIPITIQSRNDEYSADEFSVKANPKHAVHLAEGLKKLTKNSKSNLTPHPFYVFLHYSHPPMKERLEALAAFAAKRAGNNV